MLVRGVRCVLVVLEIFEKLGVMGDTGSGIDSELIEYDPALCFGCYSLGSGI